jgi:chromosome segregation ATPase
MEFSAFAEKETSALIARLLAESSQSSRRRVETLREALDSAAKALEAAAAQTPDTHGQVVELVGQIAKAATAEADARLKRLSSEARKITDSLRADLDEKTAEKEILEGSLQETLTRLEASQAELNEQTRANQALLGSLTEARGQTDGLRGELNLQAQELSVQAQELTARTNEKDALAASLNEAGANADALRADLEGERKRAETLQQQLDAAYAEQQSISVALQTATAAHEMEAGAKAGFETELRAAQDLLETTQGEAARAKAALETQFQATHNLIEATQVESGRVKAALEAELGEAQSLLEAAQAETARANAELHAMTAEKGDAFETVHAEAARANAELRAMTEEKAGIEHALIEAKGHAQAAEAKLAATTTLFKTSSARVKLLEREREEHEDALHELEARLEDERGREVEITLGGPDSAVALLDGLLGAFEALSGAETIGDVLSTLVEQLVNEFPRVALFRVKGNRLEGAHQIGFDLTSDIGKVVMPLAMDSLLTRAVSSGKTERVSGDRTDSSHLPFGGSPTCALAMPIVVDGEALAVVYADDSGQARPESQAGHDDLNARFAEALRHHTVALLTRLTSELKAMAELRGYAGSLLSETEQMYEGDVAGGKAGEELLKRLFANLDYARSIYANRVASEPASTAGLFEAQLSATIDLHRDNAFGRDLAVVMVWESTASPARKAEAS